MTEYFLKDGDEVTITWNPDTVWQMFYKESQDDIFPDKVIIRDNVTTVIWKNGDKTTVRCMEGQKYSEYDAIVQAYFKYKMGSTKKRERWMKAAMKKIERHGNKKEK